ncbi:multiple sugar transport system substrate-binding protein [Devosia crocina]|uniref:Multiple sugar transport system substrate-binding protein n=1 Tax=Devosia crocina TaxID=429728 RepID=A0A1I7NVH6_9HYPH|nr:extracellular solute-binding protein [Devosia crocina]SFV38669.1 multiple sugar transport system substrate-binding protein [Devosia crocina]
MIGLSRRQFLAAGSAAALLGASGLTPAFAQGQTLRMSWWGNANRAERTNQVIDLFIADNPGLVVEGQSLPGGGDYWTWLATQSAGGAAPDIMQMDYRYIFEYAARDVLLPLDDLIGSVIDLSDWPQERLDVGKVDGKIYGISLGANSSALVINETAFEDAGVALPTIGTTWEQFAELCAQLTAGTSRQGLYGAQDMSGADLSFEIFLRQRGKELYSPSGDLAFEEEDARAWFALWQGMRQSGACVPADVQALWTGGIDTSGLTTGRAASTIVVSNQLVAYQNATTDRLGMTGVPVLADGQPGQYLKPSMYFSLGAKTSEAETAGRFLDFFLNNEEAKTILGVERGVPESPATRAFLAPDLDDASNIAIAYLDSLGPLVGPLPPAPPKGAGEAWTILQGIAEEIAFEVKSVEQGASDLMSGMEAALARA